VFSIICESINSIERVKLFSKSTGEYVSIIPGFGANVNEIVLLKNGKLHHLLNGNLDINAFENKGIYNSAKLFPFPNRIRDGKYSFSGNSYNLPLNYQEENNACHGFVYDKPFEMICSKITSKYIEATFNYVYNGENKGFPFPFIIELKYILSIKDGFTFETKVTNISTEPFPMGDGWHPFLSFNQNIDNHFLRFEADEFIEVDNHSIPNGNRKTYNKFNTLTQINKNEFDSCFKLNSNRDIHSTELFNREKNLKIILWQEIGVGKYNYIQVYTPPERNSIAIEPMTCNINSFNNLDDLIILQPNGIFNASYGMKIE